MSEQEQGYIEEEADLQEQVETSEKPSEASINWREARETMSQQSRQINYQDEEIRNLKNEIYRIQSSQQQAAQNASSEDDDEYVSMRQLKAALAQKEKEFFKANAESQAKAKYPDLVEVVEKYGKKLPVEVREALNRSGDWVAAYHACKSSSEYYKDQLANNQHANAKKAEENAKKIKSPSSSAGGSAALGKASYYASLSNEELLRMGDNFAKG